MNFPLTTLFEEFWPFWFQKFIVSLVILTLRNILAFCLKVSSGKHRDKKVLSNLWGWKKKNISLLAASEADSTIILLVFSSYKKILESSQRLWKLCAVRRFCHSTWRVTCSLNETNSWLVSWIFSSSEASVASLVSAENVSIRVDISDNFADYTFSRKKFQHRWKLH